MNTNELIQRWSSLSLDEIEDQIVSGEDRDSVVRLLGSETVAEIETISFAPPTAGEREHVVVLPGIMGSMLASIRGVTSLLWINPLMFLKGNAGYLRMAETGDRDESPDVEVMPIGLEKLTYLKICLLLKRQTYLHEFPYDWRRPIEYNAGVLRDSLERWSGGNKERKFTLVAHSMGGLVSRAFLACYPHDAERRVKRLIMHGTPNFGAANAIENLLNGNAMMATADRLNQNNDMRKLAYCLPSVYQLLPAPQEYFPSGRDYPVDFDIYRAEEWNKPDIRQSLLDGGRNFHALLAGTDTQVPIDIVNGCHVETMVRARRGTAGVSPEVVMDIVSEGENSGDGTVPLWSSQLPGARWFYIQEIHRNLPNNGQVIRATLDLIQSGDCDLADALPKPKHGFAFETPVTFDPQATDLRAKIETGTASRQDLDRLYFAW